MEFLNQLLRVPIAQLPFFFATLVIAFSVHEFSHAYFANKFGDSTAKMLGRVTLNPMAHLDLMGLILMLVAGFGWARPVPVNRDNFSRPRLMGIIVSAAGPLSNLVLGVLGTLIYVILVRFGVFESITNDRLLEAIRIFFGLFTLMNFFLFLLNLIPLPPLDGYRILEDIVPRSMLGSLKKFEQGAVFIFLLVLIFLSKYTIGPLYAAAFGMYKQFFKFFYALMGG